MQSNSEPLPTGGSLEIPGYQMLAELGAGANGRVFLAKQENTERLVAIKVLHKHLVRESTALSRFRQESKAAGQLNHPNIVAVLSAGLTADQEPYLVLQYCPGLTLRELLTRSGPLDRKLFVDLFSQLCEALYAAHQNGILHRDIKPANILIDESLTIARLSDFGTATLLADKDEDEDESSPADRQKLTRTGHIVGTPAYMSPEQCLGQDVDARSDIYSLGCVMYECLCGQPPFIGATPLETMSMRALSKHPPTLPLTVPAHVQLAVQQACQPRPDRRPSDARALKAFPTAHL